MIREWWTDQGLIVGPAFALLIFLAVFIGILVWIFRPGSKTFYDETARMPLDDDRPGQKPLQATQTK